MPIFLDLVTFIRFISRIGLPRRLERGLTVGFGNEVAAPFFFLGNEAGYLYFSSGSKIDVVTSLN